MELLEIDEALKLNLEDGTIYFERSNKIAQRCISSQPDKGKLEDQLEVTNKIARMESSLLNISRNI